MSIFSSLLGNSKDLKLMKLLLCLSDKVNISMASIYQIMEEYDDEEKVKANCFKIENLENEGDDLVRQIIELLGEISITSWISHEMVLRLIHELDDMLDRSQDIVRFLEYYRLTSVSKDMVLLGDALKHGGGELLTMMTLFCQPGWHKHTQEILTHVRRIRELEHQGDMLKSQGLHSLLNLENGNQPITIHDLAEFRSSEKMLEAMEQLTDHMHHVSTIVHQCFND